MPLGSDVVVDGSYMIVAPAEVTHRDGPWLYMIDFTSMSEKSCVVVEVEKEGSRCWVEVYMASEKPGA